MTYTHNIRVLVSATTIGHIVIFPRVKETYFTTDNINKTVSSQNVSQQIRKMRKFPIFFPRPLYFYSRLGKRCFFRHSVGLGRTSHDHHFYSTLILIRNPNKRVRSRARAVYPRTYVYFTIRARALAVEKQRIDEDASGQMKVIE